nr:E3 ubiquitin-protein ligase UPL1-like [Tanacetum cinerariifolium]
MELEVVDHLLEILMKYPSLNPEENCNRSDNAMEIDNSVANKGKSKVDDTKKELDSVSEKSAGLAKLTFVLKLLSDILRMYVHAVGIILRRATNAVEQLALSYLDNKKKSISLVTTSGNQMVTTTVNQIQEGTSNNNQHQITSTGDAGQLINAFPHLF